MATQQELAEHLDLSQPSIAVLVKAGVFEAAARGGLNIDACRIAYIRHLRDSAAGRSGDDNLTTQRTRVARETADKLEIANAQRRTEILEIGPIVQLFSAQAAMVRTQLLSVPSSISPAVHRCKTVGAVCSTIEAGITAALEALCADPATVSDAITKNAPKPTGAEHDEIDDDDDHAQKRHRNQGRGRGARKGTQPR